MRAPVKYFEKALSIAANGVWTVFSGMNAIRPAPSFTPKWSDRPLLKSCQKTRPLLGVPRETDSLCPVCVREARQAVLDGRSEVAALRTERVGEIKATILERDGRIMMVKDCPAHGHFEDTLAMDPEFFRHLEKVFPGRDIQAHADERLHNHGSSSIRYGRGAVLTVDLTNRCNMMCDPCFMDANQVGFVHELTWDDIVEVLDNAITIKPRRQLSVQFSGGEPTLSPYFLDAVRYARKIGYKSVQVATNGIEFAKNPEFAAQAAAAGLRYAYLQFDGIGNSANQHRGVGNLFDVKLQAIENLFNAGVSIIPVITIVNGINNEQVGRMVQFALDNPKKIAFLSFQPVSFTGRDEGITDSRRHAQRYTLSHLAHDVKRQVGLGEPVRDWFPISFMSTFTEWADLVRGPDAEWGQVTCGCHPNCGVGMAVMIDKETRECVPVTQFLKAEQLARDVAQINDAARGRFLSIAGMVLALLRNYDPLAAPTHFRLTDLLKKFGRKLGATGKPQATRAEEVAQRRANRWNFLFIAGMWFQDLFTYDFRRTEMCIIPYATQQGEISFCAYNTGVGWRQIVEKMSRTAKLAEWYKTHGRHEIFAGGRQVPIGNVQHSLTLNEDAVRAAVQTDLEERGNRFHFTPGETAGARPEGTLANRAMKVFTVLSTLTLLGLPLPTLLPKPQEKSPPAWIDSSLSTISSSVQQTHRWDYVMSAKVRLLLFWAGKEDVGSGYITKGFRDSAASNVIRLVMGSDPLKAPQKINYWGSATEIQNPLSGETTFFGFMKSSKATGVTEARKEVDAGVSFPFEANISHASAGEALSHIARLNVARNLTLRDLDAAQEEITRALSAAEWKDRRLSSARNGCVKTSAFLGVMERLIQKAVERTRGTVGDCYVYNARYYGITLKKTSVVAAKKIRLKLKNGTSTERDYRDLILANFEILNTESERRTSFDLLVGTSGSLRGVPVQIHYQPNWWFQVVLDLAPSKTTVVLDGK